MDWKKRLSVLLCLCLALSLMLGAMPAAALEEETPEAEGAETAFLAEDLPNAPRCVWQSARVTEPGEMVAYTLNSYSSKLTDPQVWLAVSTTADDQVLQLSFTNVSKGTYAYIFRASTLESADPSGSNYAARFSFNSAYTGRWHADYAGVYYVMLMPSASSSVTDTAAGVTVTLIEGDTNEPNGSPALATELTENVSTYFTLAGFNDQDWFKITSTVPGEGIKIYLSNKDYTVPTISARLFRASDCPDGTAPKDNLSVWNGDFTGNGYGAYKVTEPGVYYLRLTTKDNAIGSERPLRIRYEMIPGDAQELNDGQESAFTVPYDDPVDFNLNGVNDVDWFYFETTAEGEIVTLSLTGFETDYSNRLSYNIYNAVYDGLTGEMTGISSAVYYANDVNITYSRQMSFAEPGGHFIRIVPYNHAITETPLRLTLQSYAKPDSQEPNDTRDDATLLLEEEPVEFNLPIGDKDWFKFTADKPDQTLELTLTVPAGGSLCTWLYSGADFALSGDSAASMTSWGTSSGSGSGVKTYRYMLKEAGDYYVYVKPYNNNGAFDEEGTVTYRMIQPDEHERNNGYRTSATLNEEIAASFTLPAGNDVDWFRFVATEPNQTLELTLTIPAGGSVAAWLYSQAGFALSGDNAASMTSWATSSGSGSGVKTYRYMLGDAGDYYVRIAPFSSGKIFDENATVTYRLIQPDEHERNNGYKTSTTLNEGIAASFTLPAGNDRDWFMFTADRPDQTVEVTMNIPVGGSISAWLYSGADFAEKGDNAASMTGWATSSGSGSGVKTYRYMLGEAGDYYVCIAPHTTGNIFDEDATVSFRLIQPDEYERNNGFAAAAELAPRTAASITLPAGNDADWFHIGDLTSGDMVTVTWGGSTGSFECQLFYVDEYATSAVQASRFNSNKVSGSYTFTVGRDSNFYLCLSNSSSAYHDQPMWFRYAVTAADMPVTGIASITNGNRTIFKTQTLQLYANVAPANATNQNVTWTSSNPAAATVDENGLVTGVAVGETVITAVTVDGGYTLSASISVAEPIPVTGVAIRAELNPQDRGGSAADPYPLALDAGLQLTALVDPSGATELGVLWSVSDESVLAVNEYGKIFAIGSGAAQAIVTTLDGGFEARFYVNVPDEQYPVRGISLSENYKTLYLGEGSYTLTATVSPSYATNPDVMWLSSDEAVATVDQNGVVTPLAPGTVDITVCAAENVTVKNVCSITVKPPRTRVTGISFAESEAELGLYGTLQLTPIVAPADATDPGVTWTTDNKNIATVSRTGLVTGLNLGTAVITAATRDGGFTASVKVIVKATADRGDLDNDGAVDAGDAMLVLKSAVGLIALSEAQKAVADVNGDGEIDAGDAVLILRYDAGLIDAFPAE